MTDTGDSTEEGEFAGLERQFLDHELLRWLGVDIETSEPGRTVFEVPFDERIANLASGTVHGGVTAAIIDTASGFALRTTFDDPGSVDLSTTNLDVRYVRPASDDLRVEATVVRAGETMGYTESEATTLHEGERKTVATGGTSYRLFRE